MNNSGPGATAALPTRAGAIAMLVSTVAIGALMALDFRPRPAYGDLKNPESPPYAVSRDRPMALELRLPMAPEGLLVPVEVQAPGLPLQVTLVAEDRDARASFEIGGRGPSFLKVPPTVASTRLRVEFRSDAEDPLLAPQLERSNQPPDPDLVRRVELAGAPIEGRGPLLLVTYPWRSRSGWLVWLLVAPALFFALRRERRLRELVIVLGIAVMVTSVLLWQRRYSQDVNHWDADDYGKCAAAFATLLTDPGGRDAARAWLRDYPHAHTALAPLLMSLPIALGLRRDLVYVVFSGLCGFASLVVFHRLLRLRLELSHRASTLALVGFACHLLMLRTFARPVTDGCGLLLTLSTLDLLLARLTAASRASTAALAALMLLHALARPQGLAYLPFVALATVACDWRRKRRFDARACLGVLLGLCLPAAAVLSALYFGLGLTHNIELMLRKAEDYRDASVFKYFVACVIGLVQLWPILWLGRDRRPLASRWWILIAWSVYYVAMLIAVRAPFWPRHFLPVLPVVIAWSARGLEPARPALRRMGALLVATLSGANIAFAIVQLYVWSDAPRPFLFFWRN
ncbi:MAG: hypothetical protein U1E76_23785 [Planctomycetota bacterium]